MLAWNRLVAAPATTPRNAWDQHAHRKLHLSTLHPSHQVAKTCPATVAVLHAHQFLLDIELLCREQLLNIH